MAAFMVRRDLTEAGMKTLKHEAELIKSALLTGMKSA
jgi:hypothetical protein